jgi:hypothetical protein
MIDEHIKSEFINGVSREGLEVRFKEFLEKIIPYFSD